jgi:acyl-CoA synthetase (AMP-forming)/AMP-acid ligase II
LRDPRPDAGVRFLDGDGSWRGPSYAQLADRVLRMVRAVHEQGLAGRRVAIVAGRPLDFIVQFFGLLASGATCVPLPAQGQTVEPASHEARIRRLLETARPDAVVAPGAGMIGTMAATSLPSLADLESVAPAGVVGTPDDHLTLLQFSSGTTGAQRAVKVPQRALELQMGAIGEWCRLPEQQKASWTPFHHDMGLGIMLTSVVFQSEWMVMTPVQYLRNPMEWLNCFGRYGATMGGGPAFGYLHACQKVTKEELDGCDFSGWRIASVGAEPLRAAVLERFLDVVGPYGFRSSAFCPAYGLAEATLTVTGVGIDEEPGVLPDGWRPDTPAKDGATMLKIREGSIHPRQIVSSGRPIAGAEVSVRDLEGRPVPDGTLGEIWVGGTMLADGYEPPEPERWPPGWFKTGDVGCVVKGQLFVFGRLSESFQVGGEIILAEQAEHRIQDLVSEATMLVVVPSRTAGAGITVVAESGRRWTEETAERIRLAIAELFRETETDLVVVEQGAIPRTSSGKPQRRECWRRFVATVL